MVAVTIGASTRRRETWTYLSPSVSVDFLIREGREVVDLIQACWTVADPKTERRELAGLIEAAKKTRCTRLTIVTRTEKRAQTVDDLQVRVVPIVEWLLEQPS